jgi:hypothetical protein
MDVRPPAQLKWSAHMLSKWISRSVELVRDSVERFPVTMIFALATTILAIYATELDYSDTLQAQVISWLLVAVLGIPLSIALHLRSEIAPISFTWKAILFIGLAAVLIGYGVWLPENRMGLTPNVFLQWGLLFITSHILISLSIHSPMVSDRTFWAFNMHTLMRVILGVFFTGVLNVGVILAIVASDFLFNLNIKETFYLQVTIFNHALLMTAIIVAGIPKMTDELEWVTDVPKALRLFCLYVLLPLAFLYLTILLVYSGKVIFEWSLPQGIVGTMILYYAIVGYATHILTLPFQDEGSTSTIWFGKFFRNTMPVVLILFWVAIGVRVDSYGLTIMRGLVIYLGIWLTGISLWALFSKGRPLVIIPASLAAIIAISAVGPLSISSMSRISQIMELRSLLSDAPGNQDIEKIRNTADLDSLSLSRINSAIFYLSNTHGVASLEPFIDEPIELLKQRIELQDSLEIESNWDFTSRLMKDWGIETPWSSSQSNFVTFNATSPFNTDIRGYDRYLSIQYYMSDTDTLDKTLFEDESISVRLLRSTGELVWTDAYDRTERLNIIGHIKTLPYSIERSFVELDEKTAVMADTSSGRMMFLIESGNIKGVDGTWKLQSLRGKLFVKTN